MKGYDALKVCVEKGCGIRKKTWDQMVYLFCCEGRLWIRGYSSITCCEGRYDVFLSDDWETVKAYEDDLETVKELIKLEVVKK